MMTMTPVRNSNPPVREGWQVRPWVLVTMAVAVVIALVASGVALLRSDSGDVAGPTPTATSTPVVPSTGATTPPASPSAGTPSTSASSSTAPTVTGFRFAPLWPFRSSAAAAGWQQTVGADGHQAWRLDADRVAVAFARDYLGYTEIDRATSSTVAGDQAWIGVGYTDPNGAPATAAVLHLARIGTGTLAGRPWEVVGSRDTDLTLTAPRYGATVGRSFAVGGLISGVDESLVVQVRNLDRQLYAPATGIPAGGDRTRWTATITLDRAAPGWAVVSVSTGGHLIGVERFAITAVRITG